MSLYIGRDNSNDPIVHITNDELPQAAIAGDRLSTTVFHSKYQLFSCQMFNTVYLASGGNNSKVCLFEDEFYTLVDTYPGLRFFPILGGSTTQVKGMGRFNTYTVVSAVMWYKTSSAAAGDNSTSTLYDRAMYPSSVYKYCRIHTGYTGSDVKILLTNFQNDGIISPLAPLDSTVFVDNTDILIGQRSLKNTKYLSSEQLNTVDDVISTQGRNFQLINSNVTLGSDSYLSMSGGQIVIGDSSNIVFNSNSPFHLRYVGRESISTTVSVGFASSGTFWSAPMQEGLTEGDLMIVRVPYASDADANLAVYHTYYCIVYSEGVSTEVNYSYSNNTYRGHAWLVTQNGSLYYKVYYYSVYGGGTYTYSMEVDVFTR